MSPEWLTAVSSAGTFVVIAASAIAALMQLRHLRNSNQLVIFNELRHAMEAQELRKCIQFVVRDLPSRNKDPLLRAALLGGDSTEWEMTRTVGNFFDQAAIFVKHNMVDRDLACDILYAPVTRCWDALAPFIASIRVRLGVRLWEDFEYLTLLCKNFRDKNPTGTYPRGVPPLPLPDPWPEAVTDNCAKS